jgi:NADPH:quinone reductase-like Zn-dependent oxidoreductase
VARLVRWRFGSRSCHWFVQGEEARYLKELAALVDDGLVRSHLSETVTMGDVRAGYDRIESGRTVGKVAVDVAAMPDAASFPASSMTGASS